MDILFDLFQKTPKVILTIIKGKNNIINTIKRIMNNNEIRTKIKSLEIIQLMTSFLSLEINLFLYKENIIENLIRILPFEKGEICVKYILSSLFYFINSIKTLLNDLKKNIINNLIKFGIMNIFELSANNYNSEIDFLINQIEKEIKKF